MMWVDLNEQVLKTRSPAAQSTKRIEKNLAEARAWMDRLSAAYVKGGLSEETYQGLYDEAANAIDDAERELRRASDLNKVVRVQASEWRDLPVHDQNRVPVATSTT
jgi:hypothetical protein